MLGEGGLVDSWHRAAKRGEHFATWHGYNPPVPGGPRIDWILTSPDVITRYAAINVYCDQGQYPSDHLPVQAVITLPRPGRASRFVTRWRRWRGMPPGGTALTRW